MKKYLGLIILCIAILGLIGGLAFFGKNQSKEEVVEYEQFSDERVALENKFVEISQANNVSEIPDELEFGDFKINIEYVYIDSSEFSDGELYYPDGMITNTDCTNNTDYFCTITAIKNNVPLDEAIQVGKRVYFSYDKYGTIESIDGEKITIITDKGNTNVVSLDSFYNDSVHLYID